MLEKCKAYREIRRIWDKEARGEDISVDDLKRFYDAKYELKVKEYDASQENSLERWRISRQITNLLNTKYWIY